MHHHAIVTDGLWRKSLSAIRSLGKAGYRVTVLGDSFLTTGFWSRYARARRRGPTAARDPDGFGRTLMAALQRAPGAVILPMEDASLMWVSQHRAEVEARGKFLLPSPEALEIAQDKSRTIAAAAQLGLPHPRTFLPSSAEEARRMLADSATESQWVAKPRSGSGSVGVRYLDSLEGRLPDYWESYFAAHGAPLLQERIPAAGKGCGVSMLFDRDGRCVAAFAHERLRQYPVSGGPSTDRRSVAPAQARELIDMSIRLLESLKWRGIGMVEWKLDPRDGKPKLMEINPRFWGSLELAVRAGVDFPALYAACALGEKPKPVMDYRATRCRWMMPGEILRYLSTPRRERESLRQFLGGLPRLAEEWDWRDIPGAIATFACTALLALHPRYWKYVLRG